MPYLAFVGPALRLLNKGVNFLADKSDLNPKNSGIAALAGAAATWFGIRPEDVAAIGKALVTLGQMLQ